MYYGDHCYKWSQVTGGSAPVPLRCCALLFPFFTSPSSLPARARAASPSSVTIVDEEWPVQLVVVKKSPASNFVLPCGRGRRDRWRSSSSSLARIRHHARRIWRAQAPKRSTNPASCSPDLVEPSPSAVSSRRWRRYVRSHYRRHGLSWLPLPSSSPPSLAVRATTRHGPTVAAMTTSSATRRWPPISLLFSSTTSWSTQIVFFLLEPSFNHHFLCRPLCHPARPLQTSSIASEPMNLRPLVWGTALYITSKKQQARVSRKKKVRQKKLHRNTYTRLEQVKVTFWCGTLTNRVCVLCCWWQWQRQEEKKGLSSFASYCVYAAWYVWYRYMLDKCSLRQKK